MAKEQVNLAETRKHGCILLKLAQIWDRRQWKKGPPAGKGASKGKGGVLCSYSIVAWATVTGLTTSMAQEQDKDKGAASGTKMIRGPLRSVVKERYELSTSKEYQAAQWEGDGEDNKRDENDRQWVVRRWWSSEQHKAVTGVKVVKGMKGRCNISNFKEDSNTAHLDRSSPAPCPLTSRLKPMSKCCQGHLGSVAQALTSLMTAWESMHWAEDILVYPGNVSNCLPQ